jgi:outer membrane lipoprotein SlyB
MSKVFNRDVIVHGRTTTEKLEIETVGTGTGSSAAVTVNEVAGIITSEALTTAQNAFYTLVLTNNKIDANSLVFATVEDGTNTQGTPMIGQVKPGAGTCTIEVINKHATSEALNGTLKIRFFVVNPA